MPYPNQLYTAFSFIGFMFCVIPFYWHLEAWNTATCLFMIWTGLGCLLQCVNSIVWNKNMINTAPVYCDIATRIQVALNVALPACSLCINRRLYKIASVKSAIVTREDKRQAVIQDLLIGVGIPILQIIAQYVVSSHRYKIFEDFGPMFANDDMLPTFFLFLIWPVMIGIVSLFYCVRTIYTFYKRQRQFSEFMLAPGLGRSRYFRLMAIAGVEMLATIPLGTYLIVYASKSPLEDWKSWADSHANYSTVIQVPSLIWKNYPALVNGLEFFRWSVVGCAFVFFALFGFADEARLHYRRVYTSLASHIGGFSTFALHGSSQANSSVSYMRNKDDITVSVVKTTSDNCKSGVSFSDQLSIQTISIDGDIEPEEYSPSRTVTSSSVESLKLKMQGKSAMLAGIILPTVPPTSVPPHSQDTIQSTLRPCSGIDAV